jgi:hypothetical protein
MRYIIFCSLIFLVACNPYKSLRRQSLSFTQGDTSMQVSVLIPRGASRSTGLDSGGHTFYNYRYRNGAILFFNSSAQFKSIGPDTSMHVGKEQLNGGLFYKMQTADGDYQRDVLRGRLWFGYRKAEAGKQEARLDSAMNSVR